MESIYRRKRPAGAFSKTLRDLVHPARGSSLGDRLCIPTRIAPGATRSLSLRCRGRRRFGGRGSAESNPPSRHTPGGRFDSVVASTNLCLELLDVPSVVRDSWLLLALATFHFLTGISGRMVSALRARAVLPVLAVLRAKKDQGLTRLGDGKAAGEPSRTQERATRLGDRG